jgi:prepilin-type N-terminal cleavage/methylation domain-containing protein
MTNKNKGFTLIELLVVIAIIGILSSVVLASLNSARNKGSDAAVKANINNTRAQAEIFYDNNGNKYDDGTDNLCEDDTSITQQLTAAKGASGAVAVNLNAAGATDDVTCNATTTAWAIEAPLKAGGMFCVDSTGNSTTTTGSTLGSSADAKCGA